MTHCMTLLVAMRMISGAAASESEDSALVAHYRFAEGQGDRLLDHSGHGHHGRIVGARWEQAGGRWALRFDGSGDYVDFGDNRELKMSGDFILLAWVTVQSAAPVNVIVTRCDEQAIEVSLHGHGAARIAGPDGQTHELQLSGEQRLTVQPSAAG